MEISLTQMLYDRLFIAEMFYKIYNFLYTGTYAFMYVHSHVCTHIKNLRNAYILVHLFYLDD